MSSRNDEIFKGEDEIESKCDDELRIDLFKYELIKCPSCSLFFDSEEYCFEHFLDHFENSQNFLAQRLDLLFWLKTYSTKLQKTLAEITPKSESVDTNNVVVQNTYDDNDDIKPLQFSCIVCGESFINKQLFITHSFSHFEVKIPAINPLWKCPLCGKYFCTEDSCLTHLFNHLQVAKVEEKRLPILNWLTIFFTSFSGVNLVAKYDQYAALLVSSSPLLSRIEVAQFTKMWSCKICGQSASSVFDLFNNHTTCEVSPIRASFYCAMCNFKAGNKECLIKHFFIKHIACYCGYHGTDSTTFQQHAVSCSVDTNGILCPLCREKTFQTKKAFINHIVTGFKGFCGADLKKKGWKCSICGTQSSQNAIFHHILSSHVSCCCGYKSWNFNTLCTHIAKCSKKMYPICPICEKMKYSSKKNFEKHLINCLPRSRINENETLFSNEIDDTGRESFAKKKKKITSNYFRLHF